MTLKLPPEFQAQLRQTPKTSHAERVTQPINPVEQIDHNFLAHETSTEELYEEPTFQEIITPKIRLKEYILATVATESQTEFSFKHPANNIDEVQSFIHRMRVALYRQRSKLTKMGRKPKQFGMKVKSIEVDPETNDSFIVTLCTVPVIKEKLETDIDNILGNLLEEDETE